MPLKYAARGVNGTTFELERRAFKMEIETCHAITNQVPAKPKNDLFHSLSVFCFTTRAELAGDKQKHWVCRIVEHEKPTTENWKSYFVGYSSLKNYAWSALEPGQKIDVLSVPVFEGSETRTALPPALESGYQSITEAQAIALGNLFQESTTTSQSKISVSNSTADEEDEAEEVSVSIPF